jgi:hypothetical protein
MAVRASGEGLENLKMHAQMTGESVRESFLPEMARP